MIFGMRLDCYSEMEGITVRRLRSAFMSRNQICNESLTSTLTNLGFAVDSRKRLKGSKVKSV